MKSLLDKIQLKKVVMIVLLLIFFWIAFGDRMTIFEKIVMSIILLLVIVVAEMLEYYKSAHKISLFGYLLILPLIVYGGVYALYAFIISSRMLSSAFIGMLFVLGSLLFTEKEKNDQMRFLEWLVLFIEYGLICYITFLVVF